MTTHCAVDFHARSQTIRYVSDSEGEIHAARLDHTCDDVRAFYASLQPPVIVALEAHGYTGWFEALLSELGITVWIGDAARIRAAKTRKQKNDDRDADHLLELVVTGRFPRIYRPTPQSRRVLQLLRFRHHPRLPGHPERAPAGDPGEHFRKARARAGGAPHPDQRDR